MANQILQVPEKLESGSSVLAQNLFIQANPAVLNTSGNVISGSYGNQVQSYYNVVIGPNNPIGAGSANGYGLEIGSSNGGAISYAMMCGVSNRSNGNYYFGLGVDNHSPSFSNNYILSVGSTNENYGNYNITIGSGINYKTDATANYNIAVGSGHSVQGSYNAIFTQGHTVTGHHNIVGGYINTVSSNYNLVVGGYSGGSANPNNVSGEGNIVTGWGCVVSGKENFVSGQQCSTSGGHNIVQGRSSSCTGNESIVVGYGNGNSGGDCAIFGEANVATNNYALMYGRQCTVSGQYAMAGGHQSSAYMNGQRSLGGAWWGSNQFAQTAEVVMKTSTADATPTELADAGGGFIVCGNGLAYSYVVTLTVKDTASTDHATFILKWSTVRGAGVATITVDGLVVETIFKSQAAWDATVTADTVNGRPAIMVTGEVGKTIHWVARVEITQTP